MKADLIKDIERRTEARKKAKRKFDSIVCLSASPDTDSKKMYLSASMQGQTVRLLDEGVVVSTDGYPLFYIKKGTLQAYYDALPDDYVGSINIGHMNFSTFPYLVGEWSKKDLALVDIGGGRKGLDVNLNLDVDSIFVQELKRKDYSVGISSEFTYEVDMEDSEALGLEVLNKVNIMDFAIVGEAGNVNSSNIELGGGNKVNALTILFDKVLGKKREAAKEAEADESKKMAAAEAKEVEADGEGAKAKDEAGPVNDDELDIEGLTAELTAMLEDKDSQIEDLTARAETAEAALEEKAAQLEARDAVNNEALKKLAALGNAFLEKQEAKKLEVEQAHEKKLKAYEEQSEDGMGVL